MVPSAAILPPLLLPVTVGAPDILSVLFLVLYIPPPQASKDPVAMLPVMLPPVMARLFQLYTPPPYLLLLPLMIPSVMLRMLLL